MMIEKLEQRKLLSATLTQTGGVLTVQLENTGGDVIITESANAGAGNTAAVIDLNNNGGTETDFSGVNVIRVLGGDGADFIQVTTQNARLFINGGGGGDTIIAETNPVDIFNKGTPSEVAVINPSYTGTGSIIFGGDGNDTIVAAGLSNSVVLGGAGDDTMYVGGIFASDAAQSDVIVGGDHMVVAGDAGNDTISIGVGSGTSVQIPGLSDSIILGGTGNDTITDISDTTTDGNIINGGPGADTITISVTSGDVVVGNTNGDVVNTQA